MSDIFQKPPHTYTYKVGIPNLVDYEFVDDIVNFPATGGQLHDVFIPGNVLVQDGQELIVRGSFQVGVHAASAVSLMTRFNTSDLFNATMPANANTHGAETETRIQRKSVSTLFIVSKCWFNHSNVISSVALTVVGNFAFFNIPNVAILPITIDWQCTDAVGAGFVQQRHASVVVQ